MFLCTIHKYLSKKRRELKRKKMEKNTVEDVSFAVRPFFATLLYCIFVNENSGNMQVVKIQVNSKEELQ